MERVYGNYLHISWPTEYSCERGPFWMMNTMKFLYDDMTIITKAFLLNSLLPSPDPWLNAGFWLLPVCLSVCLSLSIVIICVFHSYIVLVVPPDKVGQSEKRLISSSLDSITEWQKTEDKYRSEWIYVCICKMMANISRYIPAGKAHEVFNMFVLLIA